MNAPEYSKGERIEYLLRHGLWVIPAIIILNFFVIPWFKGFSADAHCREYQGINGAYLVFGMVFSIPILSALTFIPLSLKEHLLILRHKQYPIPEKKVFSPTKYVYGFRSKLRAYLFFIFIALQLATGIYGIYWSIEFVTENLGGYLETCARR